MRRASRAFVFAFAIGICLLQVACQNQRSRQNGSLDDNGCNTSFALNSARVSRGANGCSVPPSIPPGGGGGGFGSGTGTGTGDGTGTGTGDGLGSGTGSGTGSGLGGLGGGRRSPFNFNGPLASLLNNPLLKLLAKAWFGTTNLNQAILEEIERRLASGLPISQEFRRLMPRIFATGAGPGGGPHVAIFALESNGGIRRIQDFFAYDSGFTGGVNVALGDVTGDLIPDLVTGPGKGGGPHVRVFQGNITGDANMVQFTPRADFWAYDPGFRGGVNVAVGDVNGDGVGDIITGPGEGGGPHIMVFNGAGIRDSNQGIPMHSFWAFDPGFHGGITVAAGDIDGDKFPDIIAGAGPGGGPHVVAFKGNTLAPLRSFFSGDPNNRSGVNVAAADVDAVPGPNGLGNADIIVGPASGGGIVYVHSGHPHAVGGNGVPGVIRAFNPYPGFGGGIHVAGGFANPRDEQYANVITGAGETGGPHVVIYDKHGNVVASFFAYGADFRGGTRVASWTF